MTRLLVAVALSLVPALTAGDGGAPPLRFKHLTIEDGLSYSYVWSILQDRQGFMWFSTDGGLNRYDGYEFKIYRHDSSDAGSIVHNFVWVLYEDRAGTLWAGTNGGGLERYDRDSDTFVHHRHAPGDPRSLPHDNVKAIVEDSAGVLWIGSEGGLSRFDRKSATFFSYKHDPADPASLGGDRVYSIVEDRTTGHLWLGHQGGGVSVLDRTTGRFTRYTHDPGDPASMSDVTRHILQDRAGVIWVSSRDGLYRFHPETRSFTRLRHDPGNPYSLGDDNVTRTLEDRNGRFWVSTFGGLDRLDRGTGRFVHHRHDSGDPSTVVDNQIRTMYEDRAGALWLGTVMGISRLDGEPPSFVTYRHNPGSADSLSHSLVQALHVDRAGHVWIGTAAGLNRFDGRTFKRYLPEAGDPRRRSVANVRSVVEDAAGTLWMATSGGGLCRVSGEGFRCHRADRANPAGLGGDYIDTLHPARGGGLWITLAGVGLDHFDGRRFTHYAARPEDPKGLPSRFVLAIAEDEDGSAWLGTNSSGLVHLDPRTGVFTTYLIDPQHPNSEAANRIHALHRVGESLWIGAEAGLRRFDLAKRAFVDRYTARDGLPAEAVVSVLGDDRGGLWLGTAAGLSRFDIATRAFRNYGQSDGLPSDQFTWRACAKAPDGRLLFGGIGGFSIFDPDHLPDNPHVPPVVLTGFELFGKPVAIGAPGSPLRRAIHVTEEMTLRYDQSAFRVQFAALDYRAPQHNRYATRLEGFDREWTRTGADRRHATYMNLDPGTYVLRVRGSNNHGLWNEGGRSLTIVITPPWWRTTWFGVLAALVAGGFLFGLHRLRMGTIAERERRFRTLAESAPDIVARFDGDLRCRYVNPAVEAFTGLPADAFIGRTTAEIGRLGAGVPSWDAPLRGVLETGLPAVHELALGSPEGRRWFEARLVPEKGADGRVRSIVAVTRDITAHKQAEHRMRASLEEKVVLLKEIHHRVKNNLQVVSSLLNLQAGNVADGDARDALRQSQDRVRTMALIHEKLYESSDVAHVEAAPYLQTLVTSAIYSYGIRQDRIRPRIEADEIRLDPDTAIPLGLLVNELVVNALKHAFPADRAGTIEVELREVAGDAHAARGLRLRVEDDGVGLPEGVENEGAGTLGLQLVQALVEQLGGIMAITRGRGTRFEIQFSAVRYRPRL